VRPNFQAVSSEHDFVSSSLPFPAFSFSFSVAKKKPMGA
jgi:hypothetical protein